MQESQTTDAVRLMGLWPGRPRPWWGASSAGVLRPMVLKLCSGHPSSRLCPQEE